MIQTLFKSSYRPIRIYCTLLATMAVSVPFPICAAQAPANPAPSRVSAAPAQSVSAILQPPLNTVHLTLQSLRIDKWKKGSVRDEATVNIDAIQNDLRNNVPSLLQTADAAPGSVTKLLPLTRHIDALYDVLLRITEASRIAAPDDQATQLQQALTGLSSARLALDDRMQGSAVALEKQMQDLRATIQQQAAQIAATPTPAALPCVPPPPVRKVVTKRKPAAKPAAGTNAPAPGAAKPAQPAPSH